MATLVPSHKHDTIYVLHSGSREASEAVGRAKMSLFGSFHLEGPLGENLTPRGQKARALLALVALAKRGQRSRTWICAKLWSDRPSEQAYASLRQALTEIRKALGPYSAAILQTDQFNISIDLSKVAVDAVELRQAIIENRRLRPIDLPDEEFLEGLNVGDEEFEDWLTIERSRWTDVRDQLEQTYAQTQAAWPNAPAEVIRFAVAG